LKSLKRWVKCGADRKNGSGRKIKSPELEAKLLDWYTKELNQGNSVTRIQMLNKAKVFSQNTNFLASTGWLEKFKRKYNLKLAYIRNVKPKSN